MKHSEDDGALTLFADGDEILIACSKGHYWTFQAKGGRVPNTPTDAGRERMALDLGRFGPAAIRALRPGD